MPGIRLLATISPTRRPHVVPRRFGSDLLRTFVKDGIEKLLLVIDKAKVALEIRQHVAAPLRGNRLIGSGYQEQIQAQVPN